MLSRRFRGLRPCSSRMTSRPKVRVHSHRNHYDILGIDPHAGEDDIKAAFKRRAKEVHPDISTEPDADKQFIELKEAYETLSDAERRREYDLVHRLGRRVGFFQDVHEDDSEASTSSPFRWSRVGAPGPSPRRSRRVTRRDFGYDNGDDDVDDEEEGGDDEGPDWREGNDPAEDPDQRMWDLFRFIDAQRAGGSSIRQWQRGGDPWGSSSSDIWHRQVERQTRDPSFGRGPGRFGGADDGRGGSEWLPPGRRYGGGPDQEDDMFPRRQGWSAPGREEWRPPGRGAGGDDGDDVGPGPGRQGGGKGAPPRRPGWGDDGGFRGKPL